MKNKVLHLSALIILFLSPIFSFAQAPESKVYSAYKPPNVVSEEETDVYPNPTPGIVIIKFNSAGNNNYVVNVIDITGKVVSSTKGIATEGLNRLEIDLNKEAKGIYLVKIKSGDIKEQKKIVVL